MTDRLVFRYVLVDLDKADLLRLGVGDRAWSLKRTFQLGGTTWQCARLFDVQAPAARANFVRKFHLNGPMWAISERPFDFGLVGASCSRPFELIQWYGEDQGAGYTPSYKYMVNGVEGIHVYNKKGEFINIVTLFNDDSPRTKVICNVGSWSFSVPIQIVDPATGDFIVNPEVAYLKEDRLVVIGNELGMDLWAGTINSVSHEQGSVKVQCEDILTLLADVELDPEIPPVPKDSTTKREELHNVTADTLIKKVMSQYNLAKGARNELQWKIDGVGVDTPTTGGIPDDPDVGHPPFPLPPWPMDPIVPVPGVRSGSECNNTYYGLAYLSGTVNSALDQIVARAFIEYTYRVEFKGSTMVPVLVVRNDFVGNNNVAVADGPGGAIVTQPTYMEDVTTLVNSVIVTGSSYTTGDPPIEYLPTARVTMATGGYRFRQQKQSMESSFQMDDTTTDDAKKAAEAEERKNMRYFKTFLKAMHSQHGKPWFPSGSGAWNFNNFDDPTNDRWYNLKYFKHTLYVGGAAPYSVVAEGINPPFKGRSIAVSYDPVTNVSKAVIGGMYAQVPLDKIYDFEQLRYKQYQYRRDGIGIKLGGSGGGGGLSDLGGHEREIAVEKPDDDAGGNFLRPGEHWVLAPYKSPKDDGVCALLYGCDAKESVIEVDNLFALPSVAPFPITVEGFEDMLVTGFPSLWSLQVTRGYNGTTAAAHPAGVEVRYKGTDSTNPQDPNKDKNTDTPQVETDFPDGESWGSRYLMKMNKPSRQLSINVVNVRDLWRQIYIGSVLSVRLTTENVPTKRCRVLGYSPAEYIGVMELTVEVL